MTTKITGYQNTPVQVGTDKSVSRAKDGSAKEICEAILEARRAEEAQTDDLSLVVIKHC